jgi:hypothetical protein
VFASNPTAFNPKPMVFSIGYFRFTDIIGIEVDFVHRSFISGAPLAAHRKSASGYQNELRLRCEYTQTDTETEYQGAYNTETPIFVLT